MGIIYLIHFNDKLSHAQHYVGWTTNLEKRIKLHKSGRGSALMKAVVENGIEFTVVRTWEGDRELERFLKNKKNTKFYCPICSGHCKKLKIKEF